MGFSLTATIYIASIATQKNGERLGLMLLGLAFTMFTASRPIFWLLKVAKVPPQTLSPTEEAVGRVIGYIERLLAFCFVLDGADNAIAMLIAAKGVYRLHELGIGNQIIKNGSSEQEVLNAETEAEAKSYYIMIGTFASIAYAIVLAFATRFALEVVH